MDEHAVNRWPISKLVLDFIADDFQRDFQEVFSFMVAVTERVPQGVNSEVRNALNHLSRAYGAQTVEAAEVEIRAARGHLERAKRDCIKLAVIEFRDRVRGIIHRIEVKDGRVARRYRLSFKDLEKQRLQQIACEDMGLPTVFTSLLEIYDGYMALEDELLGEHAHLPGPKMGFVWDWWGRTKVWVGRVSTSVVAGFLLAHLWAWVDPDGPVGEPVRKFDAYILRLVGGR